MICWICSYPRSGSAWTRQTLEQRFYRPVAKSPPNWDAGAYADDLVTHASFRRAGEDAVAYSLLAPNAAEVFILKEAHRALRDSRYRRKLDDDPRHFFVKTHAPVINKNFPNEKILFLVRHPLAALVSYKRFLQAVRGSDISLERIMNGELSGPRDYLSYTNRFLDYCADRPEYIIQRYEDKVLHYDRCVLDLADFLCITPNSESEKRPADNPLYASEMKALSIGKMSSWIDAVTAEEREMVESRYRGILTRLGYRMPSESDIAEYRARGDVSLAKDFGVP